MAYEFDLEGKRWVLTAEHVQDNADNHDATEADLVVAGFVRESLLTAESAKIAVVEAELERVREQHRIWFDRADFFKNMMANVCHAARNFLDMGTPSRRADLSDALEKAAYAEPPHLQQANIPPAAETKDSDQHRGKPEEDNPVLRSNASIEDATTPSNSTETTAGNVTTSRDDPGRAPCVVGSDAGRATLPTGDDWAQLESFKQARAGLDELSKVTGASAASSEAELLEIRFVVNGEDVRVRVPESGTLADARSEALRVSRNTARPAKDWQLCDVRGALLNPEDPVWSDSLPFFLTLEIGAGGAPSEAERCAHVWKNHFSARMCKKCGVQRSWSSFIHERKAEQPAGEGAGRVTHEEVRFFVNLLTPLDDEERRRFAKLLRYVAQQEQAEREMAGLERALESNRTLRKRYELDLEALRQSLTAAQEENGKLRGELDSALAMLRESEDEAATEHYRNLEMLKMPAPLLPDSPVNAGGKDRPVMLGELVEALRGLNLNHNIDTLAPSDWTRLLAERLERADG